MNELNLTLSSEQIEAFKEYRTVYAEYMQEIDNIKQVVKDDISVLFEKMGLEGSEHKEERKVVKKALSLYAKKTAGEEKALMDNAVELVEL